MNEEFILCLALDYFTIDELKKIFLLSRKINYEISKRFQKLTFYDLNSDFNNERLSEVYKHYKPIEFLTLTEKKKQKLKETLFDFKDIDTTYNNTNYDKNLFTKFMH